MVCIRNPKRSDEIPPLFCVFQQYSRSCVFVPTFCAPGATVQSCHVSFCASTAVWESSLGSTSCFLVVVQHILFVPIQTRLVLTRPCTFTKWFKPLHPSHLELWFFQPCHHTHISSLPGQVRALSITQWHDSTNTESDEYSQILLILFFLFCRSCCRVVVFVAIVVVVLVVASGIVVVSGNFLRISHTWSLAMSTNGTLNKPAPYFEQVGLHCCVVGGNMGLGPRR